MAPLCFRVSWSSEGFHACDADAPQGGVVKVTGVLWLLVGNCWGGSDFSCGFSRGFSTLCALATGFGLAACSRA